MEGPSYEWRRRQFPEKNLGVQASTRPAEPFLCDTSGFRQCLIALKYVSVFFSFAYQSPEKKKLKKFYAKSKTICESNNLHITYYGWGANSQWLREDTRILCIQVTIQWGFQISRSGLTFGIVQLRQKLVPRLSWLWNHLDRTYSFSPWRIVSLGASSYATCVPYNKK